MGSFALTCTVSGLPILAGDPVRFILLTESPYKDEIACYSHSIWFPRSFPLRAKYNDYGSVMDFEEGPARDLWLECLKMDLVERGWGDNSFHDVPTTKDMSFDQLLAALWERRVRVRREFRENTLNIGNTRSTAPKGVPTRKRVQRALERAGLPIYGGYDNSSNSNGYMVNAVRYGTVRVRWQEFGGEHVEKLKIAQASLERYATMICAGSGSYAHEAELIVGVKPGTKDYHGSPGKDPKAPLSVESCMIREDVWQALCSIDSQDAFSRSSLPLKTIRKHAKNYWNECVQNVREAKTSSTALGSFGSYLAMSAYDSNNIVGAYCGKNSIPFSVGLATNWRKMLEKYVDFGLAKQDLELFLDSVAEMIHVQQILRCIRYWWRPSYSCGPQFGDWKAHEQALQAFASIATREREAEEKERAEWEKEAEEEEGR